MRMKRKDVILFYLHQGVKYFYTKIINTHRYGGKQRHNNNNDYG
jgi:hypothetical protein